MDYKVLKYSDKEYPDKLKKIKKSPKQLYYIGNLELLKKPSIAIIGTREITEYGTKNAKYFSTELAKKFVIISGMAKGTDAVAHKAAIEINCETIAVLGCGFEHIFPKENEKLFAEIIKKNGLILSEYSPNTVAKSSYFPERNRIVSALSDGILVIEAGYRSGTSITVNLGKIQNKKIFALPGRLDSKVGIGVNNFIKEGALLVSEIDDILKHYPHINDKKWKKETKNSNLCEEYQEIFEIIENGYKSIEEITNKTIDKNLIDTMNKLTMMEIEGIIEKDIGNGYKIKEQI